MGVWGKKEIRVYRDMANCMGLSLDGYTIVKVKDLQEVAHLKEVNSLPSLLPDLDNPIDRIFKERVRQMEEEDFSFKHDDLHSLGELADAAAYYAFSENMGELMESTQGREMYLHLWPFDLRVPKKTWSNDDITLRLRDLEKAGALIVAEMQRLIRLQKKLG